MEGVRVNVLSSSVELIKGRILKHRTDKKNVERVLPVGSRTPDLQELVIDIFRLCIQHNIQLVPEWIPREENVVADEISKSIDVDDYICSVQIFLLLWTYYGGHTPLIASVLLKPDKFHVFAAVGGTQGQK